MLRSRIFQKLYGGFIVTILLTVGVIGILVTRRIGEDESRKAEQRLRAYAEMSGDVVANSNPARLQSRIRILSDTLGVRFTVIEHGGAAVADSGTDPSLMDNHADRPEIVAARAAGSGAATRYSDTLRQRMKYVALGVQTKDGGTYFARASLPLSEIEASGARARNGVIFGACVGILVALLAGFYFARWIIRPLAGMTVLADRLAGGSYGERIPVRSTDEFGRLARALNTMATRVAEDIAARQRTEEALRKSQDELEERVAERTRELTRQIAERERAEAVLQASEERYRDLVENANDIIFTLDLEGRFTSLNKVGERITGYAQTRITNLRFTEVVAPEYLGNARRMLTPSHPAEIRTIDEVEIITPDKRRVALEVSYRLIRSGDVTVGIQGIARDVTDRKQAEERLRHNAFHDPLTGLANRALFMDRLRAAAERVALHPERMFAVLFLDLDRFKIVNDSLGHQIGDKLLVAISRRLTAMMRPGDCLARLGGDEFVILLDRVEDVANARRVADRVHKIFANAFDLDGHQVFATASIGITLSTSGFADADELLRDADTAMYRAKSLGKDRHQMFDSAMRDEAVSTLRLETDLRHAVERAEFVVHYQPIIRLDTDDISGFEALVRWQHPERGLLPPGEFLPLAEETGLIVPVGWWVLKEACRQLNEWERETPAAAPRTMSVNLSSRQLAQEDLVERVARTLDETGCIPRQLKLEITESAMIDDAEATLERLEGLRELGVELSVDDFGTGYSSLSYIHRFPISTLKLDRSFVSRIGLGETDGEIVRTIIALARNLRMETVAEGVETAEQLAHLKGLRCEYGQGYELYKPMSGEAAGRLLRTRGCAPVVRRDSRSMLKIEPQPPHTNTNAA